MPATSNGTTDCRGLGQIAARVSQRARMAKELEELFSEPLRSLVFNKYHVFWLEIQLCLGVAVMQNPKPFLSQ